MNLSRGRDLSHLSLSLSLSSGGISCCVATARLSVFERVVVARETLVAAIMDFCTL